MTFLPSEAILPSQVKTNLVEEESHRQQGRDWEETFPVCHRESTESALRVEQQLRQQQGEVKNRRAHWQLSQLNNNIGRVCWEL